MRLSGAYAALVTPLTERYEIRDDALAMLIDHVVDGGVNGISVLGSTGECASLRSASRLQVVRTAVQACRGRVLVAAGIADSCVEETIAQINAFAEAGLDLVLVAPPFFYPPSQEEVVCYYETVAARTPLPILLYNIPQCTKVRIDPRTMQRLSSNGRIVGIKDSSRDFDYLQQLVAHRDPSSDFAILTGIDGQLVAALGAGADGTWAASMNVAPGWDVEILAAHRRRDWETTNELQGKVGRLLSTCRKGTFPAGTKAAVEAIGIPAGPPAPPILGLNAEERATLERQLEEIGLPVGRRSPSATT